MWMLCFGTSKAYLMTTSLLKWTSNWARTRRCWTSESSGSWRCYRRQWSHSLHLFYRIGQGTCWDIRYQSRINKKEKMSESWNNGVVPDWMKVLIKPNYMTRALARCYWKILINQYRIVDTEVLQPRIASSSVLSRESACPAFMSQKVISQRANTVVCQLLKC